MDILRPQEEAELGAFQLVVWTFLKIGAIVEHGDIATKKSNKSRNTSSQTSSSDGLYINPQIRTQLEHKGEQ